MDRIINVNVGGNRLTKDSNKAGTRGEANVAKLRITFAESWDGYGKKVVFWDAHGMNPTIRNLTTDLLENIEESTRIYLVPIPYEAMGVAGELTFTVEGYTDGKRQRSVAGVLEVDDSPITDVVNEPTPTEVEQMQAQYESIVGGIQQTAQYRAETENFAKEAQEAKENAESFKDAAAGFCFSAETSALNAQQAEVRATEAVGKTSYIGDNGNWYAWDGEKSEFYDTGVKAQSGSEVYLGDNPPSTADVWINPNGGEYDIIKRLNELERKLEALTPKAVAVSLPASSWEGADGAYYQVVNVAGITPYSKVDLQPSTEQLVIFYEKDITFVAENENGVITVYCIGQKPANDYVMQATITEVVTNA